MYRNGKQETDIKKLNKKLTGGKPFSRSDKVAISPRSRRLLNILLKENPDLRAIMLNSADFGEAIQKLHDLAYNTLSQNPDAILYYNNDINGQKALEKLRWKDYAAIRILDYINNSGREVTDLNLNGEVIINHPFRMLWLAVHHNKGGAQPSFFLDMIELFRQFTEKTQRAVPSKEEVKKWMERHPSGLDPEIVELRKKNKERILRVFMKKIESGEIKDSKFFFEEGMTKDEKFEKMLTWWNDRIFHLRFAIKDVELLNELLDYSLRPETLITLQEAVDSGIPIFVNPYYLSLIILDSSDLPLGADLPIRDYMFTSKELVDEFGKIVAWEKEDVVEPGKPNAAGWLLPSHYNIHRRYPEVSILIPDTVGRACGGLCVSCQRMYDFQNGHLNFDLDKLKPKGSWWDRLEGLLKYFEEDSQLRDILITGGDALMSSDKSLKRIFDTLYDMAVRKKIANEERPDGEKHAEMQRIRLGTRLPVYLPQRITTELQQVLAEFKDKASRIGFKQFVIQTHFETAMEITPEVKQAVERLLDAGWIVTNQQVFTASASRRGHTAKLRKVLNEIGVLPYYTFSVKGYMENYHNFATNARAIQERSEEKVLGEIPLEMYERIKDFSLDAKNMVSNIAALKEEAGIPFLGTDRNVLNLPGVGKSLTFRVIGITSHGRRILEFDHDHTRRHSPIIDQMGKVVIVESKPIAELIRQYESMGEDVSEYTTVYGYSIGETENRMPIYEYPSYDYKLTDKFTNLELDS